MLAVGILGRSGHLFEETCLTSIRCLDFFGHSDPHARRYSVIIHSLLKITTSHVKTSELEMRMRRKQASSELFGLLPSLSSIRSQEMTRDGPRGQQILDPQSPSHTQRVEPMTAPLDWTIYDADFFALPWPSENDQGLQDFLQPGTHSLDGATVADIPLFPLYDRHVSGSMNQQ